MPSQNIHVLADVLENFEDTSDEIAKLQKVLRYLLNGNLDFENVRVKGLTAETIDVDKLSAISADLGTIVAGFIYGTYIATRNGTYPRAEMNESNNLFAALASANQYLNIGASGGGSVPYIEFRDLTAALNAIINLGSFFKIESQFQMNINAIGGDLNLSSGSANIRLNSATRMFFSNLIDNALGTTLASQLSAKANGSGINGTVYVATTPGGAANTAITFNNGVRQS